MKVLILLSVAMLAFAADENTEQPKYEAVNKDMLTNYPNCKKYTVLNGAITGCETCQAGYVKDNNKCVLEDKTSNVATCTKGDKCTYKTIGFDGTDGTCNGYSTTISNANGDKDNTLNGDETNSCLACVDYQQGSTNKCEKCATGYLLNKEGTCTPLSIKPFGEEEGKAVTNDVCFVGGYESSNPVCQGCSLDYKLDGSLCKSVSTDVSKGCVEAVVINSEPKCLKCREGYTLNSETGICVGGSDDYCDEYDTTRKVCEKCMKGYNLKGTSCVKCSTIATNPDPLNGDECSILTISECGKCNPNCVYDQDLFVCVSKHCDMFNSQDVCIRCEQGYQLNDKNECVACTNDCFTSDAKTECVDGYYKATDENGNSVCRKCEGKCTKCLSKDICKTDSVNVERGTSMNGLPCFDKNCKECNPDDIHMCYKCKEDSNTELIGGRCYIKSQYVSAGVNAEHLCRYYKQPDFITKENVQANYDGSYFRISELAYVKDSNKLSGSDDVYICDYHDNLPYYYRYYDNKLTCAGANRDPNNDCECKEGYYPANVNKFSACEKFKKFEFCSYPLNENVCGKCLDGLKLVKYKDHQNNIHYECGCPNGQRPNKNGICIPCSKECKTCRTTFESGEAKEMCLTCNGKALNDYETEAAKNFDRDITKQCQCKEGYASKTDTDIVYGCYKIPEACNKDDDSYIAAEYVVNCKECNKKGFDTSTSCTECLPGYFRSDKESDVFECNKCPTVDGAVSYCSSCESTSTCTTCVDENLDADKQCKTCKEGYSFLSVVDESGKFVRPYCLKCSNHCHLTETTGCFLAVDDKDYDARQKSRKVTEAELATLTIFCDECKQDGSDPTKHCSCRTDNFMTAEGTCKSCSEALGSVEVNFTKADDQSKNVTVKLEQLCVLKSDTEKTCEINAYSKDTLDCQICKDAYSARTASSNCTRCKESNYYPIEGGKPEEKGCRKCLDYCERCNNEKSCTVCVSKGNTGDLCEKCIVGYYKDESKSTGNTVVCAKCAENCTSCTNKATNCQTCSGEHHIPNGEDGACYACETGYYLDITTDECIEVNKAIGVLESRPVCLDSTGAEIECTYQNHLDKKIKQVIERPTKCDTSIYGVSAEPVDGRCTCKTGYFDNRTKEEIKADPRPVCTQVQLLTEDDFCIDGKQIIQPDGNYTYECSKCNAEYLELNAQKKCVCKNTHYTTKWGMCVPCGRHNKGCAKCTGKTVCTECESGYTKQEVDKDTVICKAS